MKYLKKKHSNKWSSTKHEEPLNGVANLFDVALVFIVAMLLSLMAAYQVLDFFNPESEITIMKKTDDQWKIITKKGKEIKVQKLTKKMAEGQGIRLGIAYKLLDGRVVYLPEEEKR